jgi:hypothetical protein
VNVTDGTAPVWSCYLMEMMGFTDVKLLVNMTSN